MPFFTYSKRFYALTKSNNAPLFGLKKWQLLIAAAISVHFNLSVLVGYTIAES